MLQKYKNFKLKKLNKNDITSIYELQNNVFSEGYTEEKLRYNSLSMLDDFFLSKHHSLGIYDDNNLIAFGLSKLIQAKNELLTEEELNEIYNIEKINKINNKIAVIKLIIVKKEYRGNGFQLFILNYLEQFYKNQNFELLIASVSPQNTYSLKNFISANYKKFKIKKLYNNQDRIIMIKNIQKKDYN